MTPFHLFATLVFALAVLHTFLTPNLYTFSRNLARKKETHPEQWKFYHFSSEVVYLLSEVEVVFGIWLIPLLIGYAFVHGWPQVSAFLKQRDFTHAFYITVIVVVVASRPIVAFAEKMLEKVARLGKDTGAAWWWTIMTLAPLSGALLKEPGAMALGAILLSKKFYTYKPSHFFKYATLGLLFVNVSIGGVLTTFSSRSLFVAASKWNWDTWYMLKTFGWKAVLGILLSNGVIYAIFRGEFRKTFPLRLPTLEKEESSHPSPIWITLVHLIFVGLIAYTGETAPLFLGIFVIFLGFHQATSFYQGSLHLKPAILVGFFFASLIIHAEFQKWWVLSIMEGVGDFGVMMTTLVLSAFVDNATVIYLAVETNLDKYAAIVGAMCAGGLTVIANAPNPIGLSILRSHFGGKISFLGLFLAASLPTLILLLMFGLFKI